MRHRAFLLVTGSLLAGGGLFGLACSSPTPVVTPEDAGPDGTTWDTGKPDSNTGTDSSKPDGGNDSGSTGKCSENIVGECDLVTQNCSVGNECVFANLADGGATTKCQPVGNGALKKGESCVAGNSNPCVKGTDCIVGRCTPACCLGDDTPCGNSVPEGFTGSCSLNISDKNQNKLYSVCTYDPPCKPFGIQACPANYACLVKDTSGTAACSTIFQPPGKAEGVACVYGNDCKDGMMCLTMGDAGSVCTYVCYKGGGPFDAGVSTGTSGQGGCSLLKKTCAGAITGLPAWLGICQ